VVCIDGRTRDWIATNPRAKEIRQENRKAFRGQNPEYFSKWLAENPGKQKNYARKWYLKNPSARVDVSLEWRKANPEKVRAHVRNRVARKKSAEGSHSASDVIAILEKQNWKCANCRVSIRKNRHIDHIMPLAKGGRNDASNLQGLCPTCNCRKHDMLPEEWARENGRLI